jgi:hypothetical protein
MTNTDYYRALVLGAVCGMSFLTLFYMINVALDTKEPLKPQTNFQVVDHYKGCDLLQWSSSQLAEYKYILYCPK